MAKATILFVDNAPDFLKARSELLEMEGYRVIQATNPAQARKIIEKGGIDLAIIDIRLEDNDDEKDVSGLTLAKETDPSIPKIILTNYPSIEAVRDALKPQLLNGLPPAVEFVTKSEGAGELIQAIYRALGPDNTWMRKVKEALDETEIEISKDHDNARIQSSINFFIALGIAVFGTIIIFVGITLVLSGNIKFGTVGSLGGIVSDIVGYLFYKRVDLANKRMDQYHRERVEGKRFQTLLEACDGHDSEEEREQSRKQVILAAAIKWFGISKDQMQFDKIGTKKDG
jgi:CheY-like chemotaxis protein